MRAALALGGGGARALGSIGVLNHLDAKVVALAGTSMGAVIAAYYAKYGEVRTLQEFFETRTTKQILSFIDTPSKAALTGNTKIKKQLKKWFGNGKLEDLPIPVKIVATNISTLEEEIFTSGRIVDCLLASIAIPGILPAHKIRRQFYLDGGITSTTPVACLSRYKNIIAVDFPIRNTSKKQPTMLESLFLAYEIARSNSVKKTKATIIKPEPVPGVQVLRFDRAKEHILKGELALRNNYKHLVKSE